MVAVIALTALLVVHVTLASLALWKRLYEIEHPLWVTALLSIPALVAGGFLVWVAVLAVRRLHAVRTDRQEAAEQS
jgi:hypothetical protein